MVTRLLVCLIVGFFSLPAQAQEPIPRSFLEDLARDLSELQPEPSAGFDVGVVNDDTNVHSGIGTDTKIVGRLKAGDRATVIGQAGNWYGVVLPGKQVGWIQTPNLSLARGSFSATRDEMLAAGEFRSDYEFLSADYGLFENRVLTLLERAAAFRDTYRDNPYVVVRGFDISLSLTGPTLGMSFEFKD